MQHDSIKTTRRSFLAQTGIVAAGVGLGMASRPAEAARRRRRSPNETVVLGVIGAGGRGTALMQMAMGCPNTAIAAVCDVYEPRRSQAVTLTDGKATPYIDYRELLDRDDIDAVIIGTPDHWHQRVLTDTVRAGKDAYCEKPMSKTLEQGFAMIEAVRATDAVVQIGTHRRAGQQYAQARKLVEEGKLGTIRFARGYDCRNYTILDPFAPPKEFTGELDWDRFEGPAGHHEFRPERYTAWRWFWDYAGGLVTDVGVHVMDVIHWVTGADTPKSVVCHGSAYQLDYWETPDVVDAMFDYGTHAVNLHFNFSNQWQGYGLTIYGTAGTMEVRGATVLVFPEGGDPNKPEITIEPQGEAPEHVANWLECVRSRKEPWAPVELGHQSLLPSHLANIAYRERKMVHWDPERRKVS